MYSKKYLNTFLFCGALVCLITLLIPFLRVELLGAPSTFIKIVFYFVFVVFIICLLLNIAIGISNLFRNNYKFVPLQRLLCFTSLFVLIFLATIVLPLENVTLSAGFSLVLMEIFIISCFSDILRLIKSLIKIIKSEIKNIKEKRNKMKTLQTQNEQNQLGVIENTTNQNNEKNDTKQSYNNFENELNVEQNITSGQEMDIELDIEEEPTNASNQNSSDDELI